MRILLALSVFFLIEHAFAEKSICYGTTSSGRIEKAVKLPGSGKNFVAYSAVARGAGRTWVHSDVYDILLESYRFLETEQPEKVYKYAETGFAAGGKFKPHKTHQNGLSVDFMVPVLNEIGQSVHLPTHPFNKFGYNIEFDKIGNYKNYKIDYESMAAHIVALDKATRKRGYTLWRVIFDPDMQKYLLASSYGEYLQANVTFSTKPSWVRHDEHYHVDFEIPCEP